MRRTLQTNFDTGQIPPSLAHGRTGSSQFLVGEFPCIWPRVIRDDLAFAVEFPFVDQQAVEAYGASGVDFVRADADFGGIGLNLSILNVTIRP
jgi:hypothetical protein